MLSRFYRVLVIDTGNNMRASNWQAAVGAADQIVVVSTVREDTAAVAAWALDASPKGLRRQGRPGRHRPDLPLGEARQGPPAAPRRPLRRADPRGHDVPYDKALVAGGPIDYDALSSETHDAWLNAAAVVADQL